LRERLELEHVSFTYPGAPRRALHDISLTIEANSTVGIIGSTGSGKTTFVDLILGLLRPDAGEIRIDDVALSDANLRAWQNGLGYVPQHIYLADDTIARNIAFGIAPELVDMVAVQRAASLAQIHDFVAGELPGGYETPLGERGIRLSGGQRQRIGIARALYNDPDVLVFDEATSALDSETEAAVMEAIGRLAGQKTLIIIAHRLTTVAGCDRLIRLKHGRVVTAGARDEVVRSAAERLSFVSSSGYAL
jgi:ABC-type multidrug transport system fused ATPase/permease subunit